MKLKKGLNSLERRHLKGKLLLEFIKVADENSFISFSIKMDQILILII